ncbi:MAG: hypothetical protein WD557_09560 [Dehalococcoidia bacterium]
MRWLILAIPFIGLLTSSALAQEPTTTPAPTPTTSPSTPALENFQRTGGTRIVNPDGSFIPPEQRVVEVQLSWLVPGDFEGSFEVLWSENSEASDFDEFALRATVPTSVAAEGSYQFAEVRPFIPFGFAPGCYMVRAVAGDLAGPPSIACHESPPTIQGPGGPSLFAKPVLGFPHTYEVVGGRFTPGATVNIHDGSACGGESLCPNDYVVGTAVADSQGAFSIVVRLDPDFVPSAGQVYLLLQAHQVDWTPEQLAQSPFAQVPIVRVDVPTAPDAGSGLAKMPPPRPEPDQSLRGALGWPGVLAVSSGLVLVAARFDRRRLGR